MSFLLIIPNFNSNNNVKNQARVKTQVFIQNNKGKTVIQQIIQNTDKGQGHREVVIEITKLQSYINYIAG